MRVLFLALAFACLAGCTSLVRSGSDGFEIGAATPAHFEADGAACQVKADHLLAYDVRGMSGTRYARNRLFNATFGHCMTARGYRPRPYAENLLPD